MKRLIYITLAAVLLLSTFTFAGSVSTVFAKDSKVLKFDGMVGVPRPYTGAVNAIRGVPGGGRPWVISSAEGSLKASGKIEVAVTGLVIDPNEPIAAAGTNPSATFRVVVSCLSKDALGNPTTVNVSSDSFPATTGLATLGGGNAEFEGTLELPQPCIAPIIFVTSPTGSWFAATGF